MNPVVPAVAGALTVGGLVMLVVGLRPAPVVARPPRKSTAKASTRLGAFSRRTRMLFVGGVLAGVVVAALTGWLVAILVAPAVAVGVPALLSAPTSSTRIDQLEALEEWTRSLAGIITVGVGLEQAIVASLNSSPTAIQPQVTQLAARLRARWSTEDAIRAFADELNDPTADLVAASLVLGAKKRGSGLASVLRALSASTAEEVKARRAIEADRAKPRQTARTVTLITLGSLAVLALTGTYIAPYGTPLGQVILLVLLALYVATLVWMRRMSITPPTPRFMGAAVAKGAVR